MWSDQGSAGFGRRALAQAEITGLRRPHALPERDVGALGGFGLGYFAILFLFACLYGVAWRADPQSFHGLPPDASFGYFLYFSLETITTLGYATIAPASPTVRILLSIELMLGVGWITVFFAVLIAYLQPRFERIAKEQEEAQEERAAIRSHDVGAARRVAPRGRGG